MSINVTVKGNPISINRGKMVALDPSSNKKEFDKRRLLRLEQVRQQSKELAEDVRNKVRKEKKKQMGEIEKEGKEKLKSWQNRKLLELQNQYQEALEEIGAGHREAEELENESDLLEEKRMTNEKIAQNRGRNAATKLQVQKNEENYKKAMPLQHKKLVRDIENTRAALVSCLKKKGKCQNRSKKKRKTSADINITIPDESGDDSDTESSDRLTRIQEEEGEDGEDSEQYCECTDCSDEKPSYEASSKADFNGPSTARTSTKKQDYCDVENTENDSHQPQRQSSSKKSLHSSPDRQKRTSKISPNQQRDRPKQKSLTESIDDRRKYIEEFVRNRPRDLPSDTRISDRIKHRQQVASQPDFCDEADVPVPEVEKPSRIRSKVATRPNYLEKVDEIPLKDPLELSSDECVGCNKYNGKFKPKSAGVQTDMGDFNRRSNYCSCGHNKENVQSKDVGTLARSQSGEILKQINSKASQQSFRHESLSSPKINTKFVEASTSIPFKPPVRLRDVKSEPQRSTVTSAGSKVRHYDFPNRYEGMRPSTSQVERISADSIEVIPNVGSELEWQELMKQRDREAQLRGKRALEKEKIQRDYEEMMKKLPILQRKEHISQIGTDKPEYHMSEERLKRREQERQNMLENAYLQAIPELKPQIVTLPRKKHNVPKINEPFEILDGDDSRTVPLGKWDTESEPKKMFSAEEVQEIIKAFTVQKPEDRKTKLKQLLKSLKLQKEQLLNEIKSLPNDANITSLISDLNSFSDSDEKRRKHKKKDRGKSERKRRREESDASNTSSDTVGRERKAKEKGKHGRSPLKKLKKSRPKVLVLQNTSTQTTPKAKESSFDKQEELYQQAPSSPGKICRKSHTPCDCKQDAVDESTEEVCKIFIKLKEDESPKVEVVASARDKGGVAEKADRMEVQRERRSKSPRQEQPAITSPTKQKKRSKSPEKRKGSPKECPCSPKEKPKPATTVTDGFKKPLPKEPKKLKPYTVVRGATGKSSSRQRNESWKEHLSKNSMSTTSTSYLSPPDFTKADTTASTEASKLSMYNLRKKPQQTNFDRSSTLKSEQPDQSAQSIDEQLLNYIKRLLSMSKASVDELGVSSSDVQTPTQSVIEMESNNPMAPLHNIIKFINWRAADLAKELSISADATPVPPNSLVSEMSICKGLQDESQHVPERDITTSSSSRTRESQMCRQYADFTDSCAERIANLAAMIEKLRDEKNQLMMIEEKVTSQKTDPQRPQNYDRSSPCDPCDRQSPRDTSGLDHRAGTPGNSDRENSTRYLDFPPSGEKSKGTNSTASMDEEELNRRLFEIDMSLAEKLKRFRKQKDEKSGDSSGKSDRSGCGQPECPMQSEDQQDEVDQDFLQRLQKLMEETQEKQRHSPEHSRSAPSNDVPFVPLLIDIPKLPILEPAPESLSYDFAAGSEKRHPPPSKGLITAKKFNGNISLVPHELSTIIEADSQLSTRISPDESKTLMSPSRDKVLPLSPMLEEESFPTDMSLGRVGSKQSFSLGERRSSKGSEGVTKSRDPSMSSKGSPTKLNRIPTLEEESFPIDKSLLRTGSRQSFSKDPEGLVMSKDPSMTSNKTSPTKSYRSAEKPASFKSLDSSESTKSLTCNDTTCNEATCLSLASSITSNKKSSSSSASDMASMEDMLKSIGMDWAIPTLHKTREALALTSSSSSGNVSSRKKSRDRSNASSEVSLKDFLKKQISGKISSSSLRSDASPASFCQDCSEISAIQANSSSEKGKQRTSTPVLLNSNSKSKEDQQQLFTGASDISSVRNSSCDAPCSRSTGKQTFHTVGGEDDMSSKSTTE